MSTAGSDPPQIPGFDPVRPLGQGRFSLVYLYQQRFPRRLVAVKVLRGQLGWEAEHAFELEANVLASLSSHPCIVPIHDAGRSPDGRSYLVMEYCPLASLAEQISGAPLRVEDALRIGILIAGAVDTAHAHGILHRDIKPANILMTDYGSPQLADFGIASSAADSNVVSGFTPAWSPPELMADPSTASVSTDVYSLSATVYTMLAGHAPHERPGEPGGVREVIARASTPVPRLTTPGVLATLADVLDRALTLDPKDRYMSARQLGAALQGVERELALPPTSMVLVDPPRRAADELSASMNAVATMWHAATKDAPPVGPLRSGSRTRRVGALAALVVVALAGAATALILVMTNGDTPGARPPGGDTSTTSPPTTPAPTVSTEGPLKLDADYVNVPCDGSYLLVLGTSTRTGEGVGKLRERITGMANAKYLKNLESCSTFAPRAKGKPLYQVYVGPYPTFGEACRARRELRSQQASILRCTCRGSDT